MARAEVGRGHADPLSDAGVPPRSTSADGRAARAARTRLAVIDALLSLIGEGDLRPTAARVAERAGVSLRSVFEHFEDMEALLAEASAREIGRIQAIRGPIATTGPLKHRIAALVDQRVRVFATVGPVRHAAMLQEPFSPVLRANRDRLASLARDEIAVVFATEIASLDRRSRREVLAAICAATSWETWEHLRAREQLPLTAARRVVVTLVSALLNPSVGSPSG